MRTDRLLVSCVMSALLAAACGPAPSSPTAAPSSSQVPTPGPTPSLEPTPAPSPTPVPPAVTAFASPVVGSTAGRLEVSTSLASGGSGVAGAPVTATVTALGDTYQTLTLEGVVPLPAKSLIVQLGFNNQADTGPETYDVRIYRITYADGGNKKNRLPNGGFDSGLYRWAVYGEGKVTTPKSDLGDGRLLRLQASPDQEIVINSYGIPVAPGSGYTVTVTARVPPAGSISGYVAAIFLKEAEIWRETLKVVGPSIPSVELVTGADGSVTLDQALPAGRYLVTLSYRGDAAHQMATLEQEVAVR